jgi:hypothetical protein
MVRSVDIENPVDLDGRLSLRQYGSFDAIGVECNFGVAIALQHFPLHLPVAHPAAAIATPGIDDNFAGEFFRSRIKVKRTMLQMKCSVNRVQCVAKRKSNGSVLRIKLECDILRRGRKGGKREKYNRSQGRTAHPILAKSLHPFHHDHEVMQSAAPTPT